jgi:hypothetical protein
MIVRWKSLEEGVSGWKRLEAAGSGRHWIALQIEWRLDPGYEQRINAKFIEIEQIKKETELLKTETEKVKKETEQL